MSLEALGLTPDVVDAFKRLAGEGEARGRCLELGRVMRVDRGFVQVVSSAGERSVHVPKGLLREGDKRRTLERTPVTGDWVAIDPSKGAVASVLPRKSQFVRGAAGKRDEAQVVAANIDVVFVLMGLDGDFNLRRLERYLTLTSESGARAVVLLTKAGLCEDVPARVAEVRGSAGGAPVHALDVLAGIDSDAPRAYLGAGITAALIGSSGVGKSTLANYLMGAEVMRTREVRAHDDRGKHTTSHRELFLTEWGGVVIDTPGMRELALWGDPASLDAAFPDVLAIALACRFSDCGHGAEPGCAVRAAVQAGTLAGDRLASYAALSAELAERESRGPRSRRGRPTDPPPRRK